MKKILYFECYSGISGDMTVAALLDLGADEQVLRKVLESLNVKGFSIEVKDVLKSNLRAKDFDVILDKDHENHDHDMEYLFSPNYEECHESKHGHGHHSHEHRTMKEITEILNSAQMEPEARKLAFDIFQVLAEAEASVHGTSVDQVHFHEAGAIDSIVDIISIAVCVNNLGIHQIASSNLYEGKGCIRCQHGILPIPVPAVANIVSKYQIPLSRIEEEGEFVTPTGAATIAALVNEKHLPESYCIERIGLGAGKREYKRNGILRAMILREEE